MISRVIPWNGKLFHEFFVVFEFVFVVRYSSPYTLCTKILFLYILLYIICNIIRYYVITKKYIAESLSKICHLASLNIVSLAGNLRNLASHLRNVSESKRKGHEKICWCNASLFLSSFLVSCTGSRLRWRNKNIGKRRFSRKKHRSFSMENRKHARIDTPSIFLPL